MVSSSLQVGWGIVSLMAAGCFVDSVGQPPPTGGSLAEGGGGSSSSFTGGSGGNGNGGAPSGGSEPQGGEGGGPLLGCGDGTKVAGEQCDDGNQLADDGCSASCQFESECGNSLIEPTEDCDPRSLGCTSMCKAAPGTACANAESHQDFDTDETVASDADANPFPIPVSAGEWTDFGLGLCDTLNDPAILTNVYRIQVGPYPEGVFIKVHKKGNLDPVLALYKGCGDTPNAGLFCHHADDAIVVSDVVPAGSVMFATVGDRGDGDDFDMFLWFHRFWATFDSLNGFVMDPATWMLGLSETLVGGSSDLDGSALVSPEIFVGNLSVFEVVARYGRDDSQLRVAVSFDDGVTWEQEKDLGNGSYDNPKWDRRSFDNPALATFAKVRVSYVSDDPLGRAHLISLRVQPVAPFNTW